MAKDTVVELVIKLGEFGDEGLVRTGNALAFLGKGALGSIALITGLVTASVAAYKDHEKTINRLNQTLINQGIYSKNTSQAYQELAESFTKSSAFSVDQILSAETQLQSFIGHKQLISEELLKAVLDFAAATGKDLSSAAEAIGKAIGTSHNALRRYGIGVDEGSTMAQKTQTLILGIETRFKGQAEAQILGLGALGKAKSALNRLLQLFGQAITPVLLPMIKAMTDTAESIRNNATLMDMIAGIFLNAMGTAALAKNLFVFIGEFIANAVSGISTVVSNVIKKKFDAVWIDLEQSYKNLSESSMKLIKSSKDDLRTVSSHMTLRAVEHDQEVFNHLQQIAARKTTQLEGAILTQKQMFDARQEDELVKLLAYQGMKENKQLEKLNHDILNETNATRKLELELQKRKIIQDAIDKTEYRRTTVMSDLYRAIATTKRASLENFFGYYTELQNSKNSELITIGKTAAIAVMIISGVRAVSKVVAWCTKTIPVIGGVVGGIVGGLVGLWYLEQIENIADTSLNNPGKIGSGIDLSPARLLKVVTSVIGKLPNILGGIITAVANSLFSGGSSSGGGGGMGGPGQPSPPTSTADPNRQPGIEPQAPSFGLGTIFGGGSGDNNGPGDFSNAVTAARGMIVHTQNEFQHITPLPEAGILWNRVNLTIKGGLNGDLYEARHLAFLIHRELKLAQGV